MNGRNVFFARFVVSPQEMSNKEIDLTYKLKVLQQELEQEESSHKASRALLADKSKIKVTIEGAKSESMKGKDQRPSVCAVVLRGSYQAFFTCDPRKTAPDE